jgi:hypothetical protein
MMRPPARTPPVRIADGDRTALRAVVVCPLCGQSSTMDLLALSVVPCAAPSTHPRQDLERVIGSHRASGAPRIRAPQRILSP